MACIFIAWPLDIASMCLLPALIADGRRFSLLGLNAVQSLPGTASSRVDLLDVYCWDAEDATADVALSMSAVLTGKWDQWDHC